MRNLCGHVERQDEAQDQKDDGEEQAARGPHHGDEELVTGPSRLGLEHGRAAKDKERDAVYLHAASERHERVGKLVKKHRTEDQQRGRASHYPIRQIGPAGISDRKQSARQRPCDEKERKKPRVMHAHRNARQSKERQCPLGH